MRFNRAGALRLGLVCVMACASVSALETGFLNRIVAVDGQAYRYQVYVPADWDVHVQTPVLLFLHGRGESGSDGLLQTQIGVGGAIRTRAAEYKFVVVMPQCPVGKLWVAADMQAMALAALEQAIQEFNGDRSRLYLSGLSMGGYGTWEMLAKNPGKFAAAAPVCGGIRRFPTTKSQVNMVEDPKVLDPYAETARLVGGTPVWVFHGDADETVPVDESRKMVAALKAAKGNVRYSEYPGVGHDSWDNAYAESEFVPWLLAQHLPKK